MTTDMTQIDDVKALIAKTVSASLGESEEGSAVSGFATAYIDLMNDIDIRYRDVLAQAISDIKKINNSEIDVADAFRLGQVKKSLNI